MGKLPYFCEATHILSDDGCYELFGHDGQHRGWKVTGEGFRTFYWDGQTDLSTPEPVFTLEELGILTVALKPVAHFFPGLETKLNKMKEAAQ